MRDFLLFTVGSCEDPFWLNQRSSTTNSVVFYPHHVGHRMGFDFFTTDDFRAVA